MNRTLLLLVSAAGLACTTEPDGSVTSFGTTTTGMTTASASETANTSASVTSDGSATSGLSATEGTGDSGSSSDGASTGLPEPVCGNGVLEEGEACDDGNESELDECLTTCAMATCDDGLRSGDESDIDCGGSCEPCALCAGCSTDDDCESGTCNAASACGWTARVTLDAELNCYTSTPFANFVVIPEMPAGTYVATAAYSGWTGFPPPWTPPSTGWSWFAECIDEDENDIDFGDMKTPDDTRYANAGAAFNALIATSATFDFPGGDMACGRYDADCDDNSGTVIFDLDLMCPAAR